MLSITNKYKNILYVSKRTLALKADVSESQLPNGEDLQPTSPGDGEVALDDEAGVQQEGASEEVPEAAEAPQSAEEGQLESDDVPTVGDKAEDGGTAEAETPVAAPEGDDVEAEAEAEAEAEDDYEYEEYDEEGEEGKRKY